MVHENINSGLWCQLGQFISHNKSSLEFRGRRSTFKFGFCLLLAAWFQPSRLTFSVKWRVINTGFHEDKWNDSWTCYRNAASYHIICFRDGVLKLNVTGKHSRACSDGAPFPFVPMKDVSNWAGHSLTILFNLAFMEDYQLIRDNLHPKF